MASDLDFDHLKNELEVLELMTAGFVGSIVRAARGIPEDKWDWSSYESAPSTREICEHAFAWLRCDRQQMTVVDRSMHVPIPEPPAGKEEMIQLLESEGEAWKAMARSLSLSDLEVERETWDGETRNIRSFFFHIGQNTIYKAGQIWTIYFELGLDGPGPYTAPYPNEIYGFDTKPWPSPRA